TDVVSAFRDVTFLHPAHMTVIASTGQVHEVGPRPVLAGATPTGHGIGHASNQQHAQSNASSEVVGGHGSSLTIHLRQLLCTRPGDGNLSAVFGHRPVQVRKGIFASPA